MEYKGWVSILLLLLCLSSRSNKIKAKNETKEDFELEEKLIILNRRPVMYIKDEGGTLFDCVDIYDQPAFQHPLLKDHKIQMKPELLDDFIAKKLLKEKRLMTLPKPLGCPEGTVPIRRTQKEYLIREKSTIKSFSTAPNKVVTFPQHYANVVKRKSKNLFYGSQATMNIINRKVDDHQGSAAIMQIWNSTAEHVLIHDGWGVSPHIFGDHKTRLYTAWRENDRGCINLHCPGFVQVDKNYPLGMILKSSAYNEEPSEIEILVYQDKRSMNWWLILPALSVRIGYWPILLMPPLAYGAPDIAWGGLTFQYQPNVPSPPMGFGIKPDKSHITHSGYFTNVLVVYEHDTKFPPDHSWEVHVQNRDCYGADHIRDNNVFSVVYGGPGGHC